MTMESCRLCPRSCGAARTAERGAGVCAMPLAMHIALASPHLWEEPPISGTKGSGAIFFSGCSLGCVYCQNRDISKNGVVGRALSPAQLAETMERLEAQGVHNINLVTGTHFIPGIIEALKLRRPAVPIVWNCGGYETEEAVDMLAPWVDIWLPDYKYALSAPAEKYSSAPDYPDRAMAAIRLMRRHQPENIYGEDGLLKKGMILRHMVLPLNTRNSIAALERVKTELPGVPVSLMSQYTPVGEHPDFPELNRPVTAREYEKVCARMADLDLDGFMQERASSAGEFIPRWEI